MSLPEHCRLCGTGLDNLDVGTRHVYGGMPGQAYFHCTKCDFYFLHPTLSAEKTVSFFEGYYRDFMHHRAGEMAAWDDPLQHVVANASQLARRMKYLENYLPRADGRILEIGAASGFMLQQLQTKGFDCYAVEPDQGFRSFMERGGIKTWPHQDALPSEIADQGFDLIMHFFVLDYVLDPTAFIKGQLKMLRPGGRLVFELSTPEDPLLSLYDVPAYERFFWSAEHTCYFTHASLSYFLETINQPFEVRRDQRYDLSNHMIWCRDGVPGGMARLQMSSERPLTMSIAKP